MQNLTHIFFAAFSHKDALPGQRKRTENRAVTSIYLGEEAKVSHEEVKNIQEGGVIDRHYRGSVYMLLRSVVADKIKN